MNVMTCDVLANIGNIVNINDFIDDVDDVDDVDNIDDVDDVDDADNIDKVDDVDDNVVDDVEEGPDLIFPYGRTDIVRRRFRFWQLILLKF